MVVVAAAGEVAAICIVIALVARRGPPVWFSTGRLPDRRSQRSALAASQQIGMPDDLTTESHGAPIEERASCTGSASWSRWRTTSPDRTSPITTPHQSRNADLADDDDASASPTQGYRTSVGTGCGGRRRAEPPSGPATRASPRCMELRSTRPAQRLNRSHPPASAPSCSPSSVGFRPHPPAGGDDSAGANVPSSRPRVNYAESTPGPASTFGAGAS